MEEQINRQEEIHSKGFEMMNHKPLEYGRIKDNTKTLDDAVLNLGSIKRCTKGTISKENIY